METETAEQVLNRYHNKLYKDTGNPILTRPVVIEAMEDYAKQQVENNISLADVSNRLS